MIVTGEPILTAAATRMAEDRAIAAGASVASLMERAGDGVATMVHRVAAGVPALMLCGPGNNGGDGYVAARILADRGMQVRVAAFGEPRTEAAAQARRHWTGAVEPFPNAAPAPIIVDALFGTGLLRPLDPPVAQTLNALVGPARLSIAVDLPSGVDTDTGRELDRSTATSFDLTLALGALKPAHVLQPAADNCGNVQLIDIGLDLHDVCAPRDTVSAVEVATGLLMFDPQITSHKYNRGMVAVVSGPMHGASELAALAAYRAGAGYVLLFTGGLPHLPHAIVRRCWSEDALGDDRIGAIVIGPGLGRDDHARTKLETALVSPHPLVIDGDALHLLDFAQLLARKAPTVLTPHEGEFAALFGEGEGSKIVRAQDAARRSNAIVVFKGADTVVAQPNGWANVHTGASPWLSVAGTGDVLAGAIAVMLAKRPDAPFDAASAGIWLHAAASCVLDRCFLADELADALPQALALAR